MRMRAFAKILGAVVVLVFAVTVDSARAEDQGELYANVMNGSVSVQREFRRALPSIFSYSQTAHMQNRADIGSDAAYASAGITSEVYAICPTTMCSPGSKWVMWDVPWVTREERDADIDAGFAGYRSTSSGFATGISRMLGASSAVGLAIGYDMRKLDALETSYQRNRADTLHLALFGGTNIGRLFLDAYAGWSRSWNRAERWFEAAGARDILKSNYNDDIFSAGIKASYVWILGNEVRVTPSVGVDFSHAKLGDFSEREHSAAIGGNALRSHGSSYTGVAVPVMLSVNKTFASDFLMFKGAYSLWTPEVHGGWVPQFGSKRAGADLSSLVNTGQRNRVYADDTEDSYGTVGAGLKIKIADRFIFAVEYDYAFANDYSNHSITGMYGVSF